MPSVKRPGPAAIWRSLRTAIYGWPNEVFAGGVYRSRLSGAPLVIADPALAAEVLVGRSDDCPHGRCSTGCHAGIVAFYSRRHPRRQDAAMSGTRRNRLVNK